MGKFLAMSISRLKMGLAATGLFAVFGCSNDPEESSGVGLIKTLSSTVLNANSKTAATPTAAAVDPAQLVAVALKSVKGPAMIALLQGGKQVAVLGEFERNRAYQTFTTTERQTLVLKNGVLSGSRGLGQDLMSADIDESLRLIRSRLPGSANRTHRYLDGEGQERPLSMSCKIVRDSNETIQSPTAGAIAAVKMGEVCSSASGNVEMTNLYWVASDGFIWQSRQWIGPQLGDVALQILRR